MKRILIVDDAPSWVKFHKTHLENMFEDADIDCAYSAREGYDWVYNMMSNPYDIVITDLHMEYDFEPKYAGEWLVEQIQLLSAYKNTRIVICSAASNIRMIAESYNVDYLPKRTVSVNPEAYKEVLG